MELFRAGEKEERMLTLAPPSRLSREPLDSPLGELKSQGSLLALPESILADAHGRSSVPSASPKGNSTLLKPAGGETDSAEELAHDARNFLAAVNVYCELLSAPGVLDPRFLHYASDLRQLGRTGAGLLDQLAGRLAPRSSRRAVATVPEAKPDVPPAGNPLPPIRPFPPIHPFPMIDDLAGELFALESPLRALAGPDVRLEIECAPCAGQLSLTSEALSRILFNLVANTVEAMRQQPVSRRRKFIRISAQRGGGASFLDCSDESSTCQLAPTVLLSIRDNGPGIAPGHLPRIFEPGFSTRHFSIDSGCGADPSNDRGPSRNDGRPSGRGLAIVRRLVESAGGTVRAVSSHGFGARFDIELPVAIAAIPSNGVCLSDRNRTTWKPR
jgi:signal transduction histidine kinase